jgi:hypothetical protein
MMTVSNKTFEMALQLAENGWPVFPVQPGEKRPCGRLVERGLKEATADPQQVRDWWGVVPSANVGLATGPIFAIDEDIPGAWDDLAAGWTVPDTLTVRTPSGGRHFYFRAPAGVTVRNSAGKLAEGIDVRGAGGYTVFPPSETDAGVYTVIRKAKVAPAPDELIELLTRSENGHTQRGEPIEGDIPQGQRNDVLFRMGCAMRRKGFSEASIERGLQAENEARCTPPLPRDEVQQIAVSAARYEPQDVPAGWRSRLQRALKIDEEEAADLDDASPVELRRYLTLKFKGKEAESDTSDKRDTSSLAEAPPLPGEVYETLPPLLREAASTFQQRHERDVFLTAAVPVLGACMPHVEGYYGHVPNALSPHSFACIVAGAAGGKGPVKEARRFADEVNAYIREASERERARWKERRRQAEDLDEPFDEREPPERSLRLPANTSAASFHEGLKERDESALVIETEIDTLTNALGQEWGKFDDTLRKAYHHEPTSYRRKGTGNVELERPAVSAVLSGTPNQLAGLMGSTENGLYSRFALYCFDAPPVWVSQRPTADALRRVERFEEYAGRVLQMWKALDSREEPIRFRMTDDQWTEHDETFRPLLRDAAMGKRGHFSDVLKRAGIVAFRISMTLTVLRAFESGVPLGTATDLLAEDEDVQASLALATTYADHSMRFAEAKLTTEEPPDASSYRIATMLAGVGHKFASGDAYEVADAEGLDVSERTLRRDLKTAAKRGLIRPLNANGRWEKTASDPMSGMSDVSDAGQNGGCRVLSDTSDTSETLSTKNGDAFSEDDWEDI